MRIYGVSTTHDCITGDLGQNDRQVIESAARSASGTCMILKKKKIELIRWCHFGEPCLARETLPRQAIARASTGGALQDSFGPEQR